MRRPLLYIYIFLIIATGVSDATVLVWDNDAGATLADPETGDTVGTEYALVNALNNCSEIDDVQTLQYLPDDLNSYQAIFVLLGFYPYNGSLTPAEMDRLIDFIDTGKSLYIEGGDFGHNYSATELFQRFDTVYEYDGRIYTDGNVDEVVGMSGTFVEGISLQYNAYQTELADNYIDELSEDTDGQIIFTSKVGGVRTNGRAVLATDSTSTLICSSFIFGSLKDGLGDNNKNYLMNLYVGNMDLTAPIQSVSFGKIKILFE